VVGGVPGYLLITAALAALIAISKVPVKLVLGGLKPIIFILIITAAFNLFLVPGERLWQWWIFSISREGILQAVRMSLRLVYLVLGSSMMTLTTTPLQLTAAMERIFRPLAALKVPVHEVAMMMSIALRFIPILLEETDKTKKAQMARGADFEGGGLIRKIKSLIPLLVPLFVSAFQRAGDLALAMEARCYHGGRGRTQRKPLKYGKNDAAAFVIIAAFAAACVLCLVKGW